MKKPKKGRKDDRRMDMSMTFPSMPVIFDKKSEDEKAQFFPQNQLYSVDTIMTLIDHIKSL